MWPQAVDVLRQMEPNNSIGSVCELFGVKRQAWYERKDTQARTEMAEVVVLKEVTAIRKEHKKMGTEKIHFMLHDFMAEHSIKCGRDKLFTIMGEHGLLVRQGSFKPRTTNSNHPYRRYPNLVRDLVLMTCCKLWVSDITYIRTALGFVYLSLITDAYSHKIVGWCLWPSLSAEGAVNALKMALSQEKISNQLIHHSDRGIQYCCSDYVTQLTINQVSISMTENGDPYENAIAERVNGILKDEYELNETFDDYLSALEAVKLAVYKYNEKRPHASVDYLTPSQAHSCTGEIPKRWGKKKEAASNSGIDKQN